jgi:hypothetical protein
MEVDLRHRSGFGIRVGGCAGLLLPAPQFARYHRF